MKQPTLGIVTPTPGRATLWRTLNSIAYQGAPVEDVLVVGDGYHAPTAALVETARDALKLPVRYVATERTRDWGHTQSNYGLAHVRGDYVILQDDDDIFVPRALTEAAKIIAGLDKPKPVIGRSKHHHWGLLWQQPGPTKAVLMGHCLVVPNDKKKLGHFTAAYNGDQAYIHHCLKPYDEIAWTDRVWTLTRPHWMLWPMWATEGNLTWTCDLYRGIGGVAAEVAVTVLLERDETTDRFFASVFSERLDITVDEYAEIAEFLVYAGQSKDIWIKTEPSEGALALGLRKANFKEHARTKDYTEFTHDWPPDFWKPHPPFTNLFDQNGERILDWRDDVWGRGRRNT